MAIGGSVEHICLGRPSRDVGRIGEAATVTITPLRAHVKPRCRVASINSDISFPVMRIMNVNMTELEELFVVKGSCSVRGQAFRGRILGAGYTTRGRQYY